MWYGKTNLEFYAVKDTDGKTLCWINYHGVFRNACDIGLELSDLER